MSCPKCGCPVTYCANEDDVEQGYDMEKCATCGSVFYSMDADDEPTKEPK